MSGQEKFEKPGDKGDGGTKISRRDFLTLSAATAATTAAAVGAFAGLNLLKRHSDKKLAEREKKSDLEVKEPKAQTPEELIKESNNNLEDFENSIKQSQKHLTVVGDVLTEFEIAMLERPQRLKEVRTLERILKNITDARESQEYNFKQYQSQFAELVSSIDTMLIDTSRDTKDVDGLIEKWASGEYSEKKKRIEERMKLFVKQYDDIDLQFGSLIAKIEAVIQEIIEELEKKTRPVNVA